MMAQGGERHKPEVFRYCLPPRASVHCCGARRRNMFKSVARSKRARRLLGTTHFIVLSNFLRSGIVDFLGSRPGRAASLDEVVDFYFTTATPATPEDIDVLLQYYKGAAK